LGDNLIPDGLSKVSPYCPVNRLVLGHLKSGRSIDLGPPCLDREPTPSANRLVESRGRCIREFVLDSLDHGRFDRLDLDDELQLWLVPKQVRRGPFNG
jgi:hypothetical protein